MPEVLKGAAIQRYSITEKMSQGRREYLDVEQYESENKGAKSKHHNYDRLAMQGITGVDDKRRIIMSFVPKGYYLANSCNYILKPDSFDLKFILGVLNSNIINWLFKKTSTNSNVNCYEIDNIPIPVVTISQQQLIITLVNYILFLKNKNNKEKIDIVSNEIIANYFERVIDACVYELYFEEEIKSSNTGILSLLQETLSKLTALSVEQQINQLYSELNDYKNEIRNRIILQETRSESVSQIIKTSNQ
jgi:hypothetical protein